MVLRSLGLDESCGAEELEETLVHEEVLVLRLQQAHYIQYTDNKLQKPIENRNILTWMLFDLCVRICKESNS